MTELHLSNGIFKIEAKEYQDQPFVDVRRWFDADGQLKPTTKGVMIRREDWLDFMKGAQEFTEEMFGVQEA